MRFYAQKRAVPKVTRSSAPDRDAFRRRMKVCEDRAGSQSALARKARIAQSTIRGYSSRNAEPPRDVLIQLAQASDVSLVWLATGEGPMEQKRAASFMRTGVSETSGDVEEIVAAAAKAFGVPLAFAEARLARSVEMQSLQHALEEWSTYRTLPILCSGSDTTEPRTWGVIPEEDLRLAAPQASPRMLSVYKVMTTKLMPRFNEGDWALIDRGARVATGTFCTSTTGVEAIDVREIKVEPSGRVVTSGSKDRDGNWSGQNFANEVALKREHVILGRLVAAIRFVAEEQIPTR